MTNICQEFDIIQPEIGPTIHCEEWDLVLHSDPICGHQIETVLPFYTNYKSDFDAQETPMNGQQGKID